MLLIEWVLRNAVGDRRVVAIQLEAKRAARRSSLARIGRLLHNGNRIREFALPALVSHLVRRSIIAPCLQHGGLDGVRNLVQRHHRCKFVNRIRSSAVVDGDAGELFNHMPFDCFRKCVFRGGCSHRQRVIIEAALHQKSVKDPLALDETLRRQLIQFVSYTLADDMPNCLQSNRPATASSSPTGTISNTA